MYITIYATDRDGTQLMLVGYSANVTTDVTDPEGIPVVGGNAAGAAYGEDDSNAGGSGIANNGSNNNFAVFDGISGRRVCRGQCSVSPKSEAQNRASAS